MSDGPFNNQDKWAIGLLLAALLVVAIIGAYKRLYGG